MGKIKVMSKKIYLLILINVIIFTAVFLYVLNKRAMPVIMSYANAKTKRLGIEVLRNVGLKDVNKLIKNEELFKIIKNNNGEIESIDFNTSALNDALILVAKSSRKKLKEIEEGKNLPEELYHNISNNKLKKGIIYEIPLGVASNNNLFKNIGPKIPVKIEYTGNVGLDVKSRVKPYGLNSALIEIYIYVEVTQITILPFQSKEEKLTSEIPIVMKVIKGTIPNYLSGTNSIPIN